MRQQQQQQLQYQQQQRQKQLEELKNKNGELKEVKESEKKITVEKRKTTLKIDDENGGFSIRKRIQSNEPVEKKIKKVSIVEKESNDNQPLRSPIKNETQTLSSLNSIQTSPYQNTSTRTSLSPSLSNAVSNSNSLSYTNGASQNSLISNANMSNIFSHANKNSNNLNKSNLNSRAAILGVDSNPILWSAKDVCKYLTNNKFDSNLIYLIEEHVSSFLNAY
jgi:hypothetical protein